MLITVRFKGLTSFCPSTVEIENLVNKIQIMLPQYFHYGCRMKKKNLPFARVMLIELSERHSKIFLLSYPLPVYVYSKVTYLFLPLLIISAQVACFGFCFIHRVRSKNKEENVLLF